MVELLNIWLLGHFLWGITSLILILSGALYYYRGNQKDDYKEKLLMHGFAYLFILVGLSRIIFSINESVNLYDPETLEINAIALNFYHVLTRVNYVFFYGGITVFIYIFERIYKRSKFILTIAHFGFLGIIIFSELGFVFDFLTYFLLYFDGFLVFLILLMIIKWSQFEFRAISSLLLQGYILLILGLGLYDSSLRYYYSIFSIAPPIMMIFGCLLILSPMLIEPNRYSQAFKYWIILSIFPFVFLISLEIFFISVGPDFIIFIVNGAIFLAFLIFAFALVVKIIRTEPGLGGRSKPLDIGQMFSKPPKFTEEEITFYRDKKLCLVCKNKVSRKLYLCPDCNVLYCEKCSDVLANAENACWVCDTPFDESKPTQRQEVIDKGVQIEEISKKSDPKGEKGKN